MEFGKLPSVEGVDFSLAPDPESNGEVLQALRHTDSGAPCIYLGATGYSMKPWIGKWYPAGAKDRDMLRWYGRQFNTIEHNVTHYRMPDEATASRWKEETPDDFRFCPKILQTISHSRDIGLSNGLTERFVAAISGLEGRLGCCFMQMPPGFSPADMERLWRFLDYWPRELPLAVEVRHPGFFDGSAAAERYFAGLANFGAGAVITDVAGRRDVCHMRVSAPATMIRFVGNGLHPTDYQRARAWALRLKEWFDMGLRQAYFFTHEPDNILAPEMAGIAAREFAAAMPTARMRSPEPVGTPPAQGSLF